MRAIAETPENPKAYLVAGQAAVGLQDWVQADTMFDRALSLNPGYSDQIEAEREAGWVVSYNLGAEALNDGDLDRAAEMFQAADRLYQGRPEARIGLGSLYVNQGDQEAAARAISARWRSCSRTRRRGSRRSRWRAGVRRDRSPR